MKIGFPQNIIWNIVKNFSLLFLYKSYPVSKDDILMNSSFNDWICAKSYYLINKVYIKFGNSWSLHIDYIHIFIWVDSSILFIQIKLAQNNLNCK